MNRLQLATLLSWAGESGVRGRKRLQKVVYFLQQAGCPLDCAYTLHRFGPYSLDVAHACDEMVAAGLIEEEATLQSWGTQYSYKLKPRTQAFLDQADDQSMESFREQGAELIAEDLWLLELGSTIRFYFGRTENWDCALEKACVLKKVRPDDENSKKALELAMRVRAHARI
jgi:uncharacterized protein YwgA